MHVSGFYLLHFEFINYFRRKITPGAFFRFFPYFQFNFLSCIKFLFLNDGSWSGYLDLFGTYSHCSSLFFLELQQGSTKPKNPKKSQFQKTISGKKKRGTDPWILTSWYKKRLIQKRFVQRKFFWRNVTSTRYPDCKVYTFPYFPPHTSPIYFLSLDNLEIT